VQSIDTNVLVRLLVQDDAEQSARAVALLRKILSEDGVWISLIVIVETVWVLRSGYKFSKEKIVTVIREFLSIDGVFVDRKPAVEEALGMFESGPADFSDYLILGSARSAKALPLWTFDQRLARAVDGNEASSL
jgi:predicted nucleic-acid-binding protein